MRDHDETALSDMNARDRFDYLLHIIRERIISRQYEPGSRIGEEELASEFGVSRTPIRRVLSRLEYEEFVEIRQASGTYITEIEWEDLKDAYAFRMSLAELMGTLSPRPPTPESIAAVRRIRDAVAARGPAMTPAEYRTHNNALHREITNCIGNEQLRKTASRLYYLTQRHWHAWQSEMDWQSEVDSFQWQLDATLQALEIGDIRGVGVIWRTVIAGMIHRLEAIRTDDPAERAAE